MAIFAFTSTSVLIDLLRRADPQKEMQIWVLSSKELAVGREPGKPQTVIDLSQETLCKSIDAPDPPRSPALIADAGKTSRRSGVYWFEFRGERHECRSLKYLLAESLMAFEAAKPGTLMNLSRMKGRTKRIVAQEPSQLFESTELVTKYAEPLGSGWYFGTNNSAVETRSWLKKAAECAGFRYGDDYTTSLGSGPINGIPKVL